MLAFNVGDLGDAGEQHGRFHLAGEMAVYAFDPTSAASGQSPKSRPPNTYGGRAERQCLEYVDTATLAAVKNNWNATLDDIDRQLGGLEPPTGRCSFRLRFQSLFAVLF